MEEAYQILDYLTQTFKNEEEQNYIKILWDSFESNYDKEKYQFAYLAFHMLMMSFVYCIIWQIKEVYSNDFNKALIGFSEDEEKILNEDISFFRFSMVQESKVFRFLKLIKCDNRKIGHYKKLVKFRNEIAHSNGYIYMKNQTSIDNKIAEVLIIIEDIQFQAKSMIRKYFKQFLLNSYNPEDREYSLVNEQISEQLIKKNYMSKKDLEHCLKFDIEIPLDVGKESINQFFIVENEED